ncbi:MAG TPA: DUF3341 domain-containing protein [Planctomycetota bacterium]|nr:DUF3341 domain-containing protein [Planctomycetota bacterium]
MSAPKLYGIMAEFDSPEHLIEAVRRVREEGYQKIEAYTPFPVEGLAAALGYTHTGIPTLVLLGGIAGAIFGYGLQYWTMVIDYPLNIGGRPLHSWPAFIPSTFETTVLFAALTAVLGMLFMNGLPTPYHPVFNVPRFALASNDRFFLCVQARDPRFEPEATKNFLQTLKPREVSEVLP